ncbi:MAG: MarR family transcriptional regulator [Bacteroidota bacterium]
MELEKEISQKKFKSEFQKASLNLIFTSSWLINRHKDFFKPFGITPQQYNVLRILRGSFPDSLSTSDIKSRMLDKNSDVSRIVDRITLKSWAEKKVRLSDRRLVDVKISDKGLELLDVMDQHMDIIDTSLGQLSANDAKELNILLDKIRRS